MNAAQEAKLIEIFSDLPKFAENILKIRAKSGQVVPFAFNRGQHYLHKRLEAQLDGTGRVRAIILKGRQGGYSTYTQARFFRKIVTSVGLKAFILTHEAEATKNIFNIAKTYYDKIEAGIIPTADTSSAKELHFKKLNSGYGVATAGNKSAGRSQTIQLFHGSEVAFWPNAEEHAKGVLQAISNERGTEIILESTANGIGNYYYNMWQAACSGESEFQAIFIPWYWQTEYTAEPREHDTLTLTDEEEQLLADHSANGLTINHLYWRRRKLKEFSNDYETACEEFLQEYPFTALDAFRNPVADRFIKMDIVKRARQCTVKSDSPLVIGVDPALGDSDALAIIRRKGRLAYDLDRHHNMTTMEIVGLVRRIIDVEKPAKVMIDSIGIGAGIYDRLRELGYDCVEGVNVARGATAKDKYKNLRAELWHDMREWLAQDTDVQIPDCDILAGDLTGLGYKFDSSGRLQIESKDDLKARGLKSPDCFVAGTLIDTPHGKRRIETLKAGEYVSTPVGVSKIVKNWETTTDTLATLKLKKGKTLIGKPNHKIFTWSRGWVKLDSLVNNDLLESNTCLNKLKWAFLKLLYTRRTDIGFKAQVDTIHQERKLTARGFCTGVFGSRILEQSKKAIISTIKTVIGRTTELRILSPSTVPPIEDSICLKTCQTQSIEKTHWQHKKRQSSRPRNGITQKKVQNGIQSTQKMGGKKEKPKQLNALSVKTNLKHILHPEKQLDFVQKNASKKDVIPDKKQSPLYALGAIKSLWQISTGMLRVVPISVVVESVPTTKVYNLTLESENVYYANGILVANCADALALTFFVGDFLQNNNYTGYKMPENAAGMFT